MVESFTIKEEKFVDQIYYLNLGVSLIKEKFINSWNLKIFFHPFQKKNFYLFL